MRRIQHGVAAFLLGAGFAPTPQDAVDPEKPADPEQRRICERILGEIDGLSPRRGRPGSRSFHRSNASPDEIEERIKDFIADLDDTEFGCAAHLWSHFGFALYEDLGRPEAAVEAFRRALELLPLEGMVPALRELELHAEVGLAEALDDLDRFEEALAEIDRAVKLDAGPLRERHTAWIHRIRAQVLEDMGRDVEALAAYRVSQRGALEDGDDDELIQSLTWAALLERELGQFAQAYATLERLIDTAERLRDPFELALAVLSRSEMLSTLGRDEEALADVERALPIVEASAEKIFLADLRSNRVELLYVLDRGEEALAELDRILPLRRSAWDDSELAGDLVLRFLILYDLERDEEAAQVLSEAELLALRVNDPEILEAVIRERADLLLSHGLAAEALAEIDRIDVSSDDEREPDSVLSVVRRARALRALGRVDEALALVEHAADRVERFLREQVQLLGEESSLALRRDQASIARFALGLIDDAGDAKSLARIYRITQVFRGLGIAALLAEQRRPGSGAIPKDLAATCDAVAAELHDAEREFRRCERALEEVPAGESRAAHGAFVAARARVTTLQERMDRLIETIRATDRAAASVAYPRAAKLAQVQEMLPAGTALIEYLADDEVLRAFVMTRGQAVAVELGSVAEIAPRVGLLFRVASTATDASAASSVLAPVCRELMQLLVEPALAALGKEAPPGCLLIAPDGDLCRLPFELLLTDDVAAGAPLSSWPFLVQRFDVAYVHSGTTLREMVLLEGERRARRETAAPRLFALGHADYRGDAPTSSSAVMAALGRSGFAPLPASAGEVLDIAGLFADGPEEKALLARARETFRDRPDAPEPALITGARFDVRLRGAATESALEHDPAARAATVVHLACHGQADLTSPALSCLVLAQPDGETHGFDDDGFVSLQELRDLRLAADLVVLSACGTNAGTLHPYDGIAGLSRAALAGGAGAVLSTLWKVSDASAPELMTSFYRHWLGAGRTKVQALALAKREAIAHDAPLSTWAACTLWDTGR